MNKLNEQERQEFIEKVSAFLRGHMVVSLTFAQTEKVVGQLVDFVIEPEYELRAK